MTGMLATILIALSLSSGPVHEMRPEVEATAEESRGLLVRLGGDLVVAADERYESIAVIGGSATIAGAADHVVVVDGTAILDGARVGELIVVDGHAVLRGATVVRGDLTLIESTLDRDDQAEVIGEVRTRPPWQPLGFWIGGVLLPLGFVFALVLAGLAVSALAPAGVRRAEAALTRDIGGTVLAALLVWIVVPIAVALSFAAIVTIPVGIGVLLFLLPAIAFFGYVIAGIRIGDGVLSLVRRGATTGRPYLAAVVGIPLLVLIGMVPVLGGLVTVLSVLVGGGAIGLVAWRTIRGRTAEPAPAPA